MAILQIISASGLLLVFAFSLSRYVELNMSAHKHGMINMDMGYLRRYISDSVSCTHSIPAGVCSPLTNLQLFQLLPNGSLTSLVSAGPNLTKIGDFTLRAQCSSNGNGIVVRAARLKRVFTGTNPLFTDYLVDLLTKRVITFNDRDSLVFPSGMYLCSGTNSDLVTTTGQVTLQNNNLPGYTCGSLDINQGNGNPRFWNGFATCPLGYTAINGGDNKSPNLIPYTQGGWIVQDSFRNQSNPREWRVSLCVYTNPLFPSGTFANDGVYALCQRNR